MQWLGGPEGAEPVEAQTSDIETSPADPPRIAPRSDGSAGDPFVQLEYDDGNGMYLASCWIPQDFRRA